MVNSRGVERIGRSILYRERLAETLPGILSEVVDHMDSDGLTVLFGKTLKIVRDNCGVAVQELPTVDPRQRQLWDEEQESVLHEVDPREQLDEMDEVLGGKNRI